MTVANINHKTQAVCDWCGGGGKHTSSGNWKTGEWYGNDWRTCSVCEGTGVMTCGDAWDDSEHCNGHVETLSGTYCEYHRDERNERLERARRAAEPYMSVSPPDWYDYMDAGEYWGEDDY